MRYEVTFHFLDGSQRRVRLHATGLFNANVKARSAVSFISGVSSNLARTTARGGFKAVDRVTVEPIE